MADQNQVDLNESEDMGSMLEVRCECFSPFTGSLLRAFLARSRHCSLIAMHPVVALPEFQDFSHFSGLGCRLSCLGPAARCRLSTFLGGRVPLLK